MTDFDLNTFLKNYKPKKLDLTPYLKLDKLKGYQLMDNNDPSNLFPKETYVKYLKRNDAFKDKDLKLHIRGGILLAGGTIVNNEFVSMDNRSKWTHLLLQFSPFPTGVVKSKKGFGYEKVYDYDSHTFRIKLNDYYIFYKYYN